MTDRSDSPQLNVSPDVPGVKSLTLAELTSADHVRAQTSQARTDHQPFRSSDQIGTLVLQDRTERDEGILRHI